MALAERRLRDRINMDRQLVAVIGGSQCSEAEAGTAEAVGRELARAGAVLVCGGMGGVMEAACRGVAAGGGLTVGILPGDDRREANPFVQIPIVTGLGEARNVAVVKSAQAVIAIGGGYGTLSEIAHARRNGIPVIGLNSTWNISRNGRLDESILIAASPEEAVDLALRFARRQ
jgi:uncharacterized protein (TIGR00725 family)